MKLTDLKSPYRELAEMRRDKEDYTPLSDDLQDAFDWIESPEEIVFWDAVDGGEFPDIPQSSHFELAAWKLQKRVDNLEPELKDVLKSQLKDPTALIESPDHRLFTAAVAAMQGILSNGNLTINFLTNAEIKGRIVGEVVAEYSVNYAKALLTEIDKK